MLIIPDEIDEELREQFTNFDYHKIENLAQIMVDKGYVDESMKTRVINKYMAMTLEQRKDDEVYTRT